MNEYKTIEDFFLLNRICIFLLFLSPHRLRNTIWFPQLSPSAWSSKWPGDLPAAHCWASQHGDRCPGAAGRRSHQSPEKVLATPFQGTCFGTLIWSGDMPHRLGACKGHPWSSKAFVALPQHAWSQRSLALWTELPKFPQKFEENKMSWTLWHSVFKIENPLCWQSASGSCELEPFVSFAAHSSNPCVADVNPMLKHSFAITSWKMKALIPKWLTAPSSSSLMLGSM